MSAEERLKWLKEIEKDIFVCSLESTFVEDTKSCAIHSAIEALENQKYIIEELEKIKAEIQETYKADINNDIVSFVKVLNIMCKHISELKGE